MRKEHGQGVFTGGIEKCVETIATHPAGGIYFINSTKEVTVEEAHGHKQVLKHLRNLRAVASTEPCTQQNFFGAGPWFTARPPLWTTGDWLCSHSVTGPTLKKSISSLLKSLIKQNDN